jgi:serine/threonine-protein kinase PRP4
MYKAGRKEIEILTKLGQEDPEGRRNICKLLGHFEYKNHLCMVFVPAEMNLRKLLQNYGKTVGISLTAVREYARQLMTGLHHMIKCKVVHGDIKLDNILITKDLKKVSICDFGTADWIHECTITPYMVSRYYRPPEICLGLRYGYAMDLWSVGVCLYELYTGKFMFTGKSNNDMLKQFMDYKGAPSKKMLRQAQFKDQHFEEEQSNVIFKYLTKDVVTKEEIIQKIKYTEPSRSIIDQLRKVKDRDDNIRKVKEFADLLDKIFILDPEKRITVNECLRHPFLQQETTAVPRT